MSEIEVIRSINRFLFQARSCRMPYTVNPIGNIATNRPTIPMMLSEDKVILREAGKAKLNKSNPKFRFILRFWSDAEAGPLQKDNKVLLDF